MAKYASDLMKRINKRLDWFIGQQTHIDNYNAVKVIKQIKEEINDEYESWNREPEPYKWTNGGCMAEHDQDYFDRRNKNWRPRNPRS